MLASRWTKPIAHPWPHTWTSLAGTPVSLHHNDITWYRNECTHYIPSSACVHAPPLWRSSIICISSITAMSSEVAWDHHMIITWSSESLGWHLHTWLRWTISTVQARWEAGHSSSPLANCSSSPVCRSHGTPYMASHWAGPICGNITSWLHLWKISWASILSGAQYIPDLADLKHSIALWVLPELVGPAW